MNIFKDKRELENYNLLIFPINQFQFQQCEQSIRNSFAKEMQMFGKQK